MDPIPTPLDPRMVLMNTIYTSIMYFIWFVNVFLQKIQHKTKVNTFFKRIGLSLII